MEDGITRVTVVKVKKPKVDHLMNRTSDVVHIMYDIFNSLVTFNI